MQPFEGLEIEIVSVKLKQLDTCIWLKKLAKLALKKWNCFRILRRQFLWNGNIDAKTH